MEMHKKKDIIESYIKIRNSIEDDSLFNNGQKVNNPIIPENYSDHVDLMVITNHIEYQNIEHNDIFIGNNGMMIKAILMMMGIEDYSHISSVIPYAPVSVGFSQETYKKFLNPLIQQIKWIKPKVIITLGRDTAKLIFDKNIYGFKRFILEYIEESQYLQKWDLFDSNIESYLLPAISPFYLLNNGINADNIIDKINKKDDRLLNDFYLIPFLTAMELIDNT